MSDIPDTSERIRARYFYGAWTVTGVLVGAALAMAIWYAPVDPAAGPIQKLAYIHVGAAVATLVACLTVFIASISYLWQRSMRSDNLADSAARVAVLLLTIVLVTGMIWAKQAWGHWWEWSPPLTFSLILWLLHIAYVINRRIPRPAEQRASMSAVIGVLMFIDVPLVYLSVQFLPQSHLSTGAREPAMDHTLFIWIVATTMLTVCMIHTRSLLTRPREASAERAERPGPIRAATAGGRV